jgi:acetolactate synthase-1/2/3 large subunit
MPLFPSTPTTGTPWRTKVSNSIPAHPNAPSPSSRQTCRSGCARFAARAAPGPLPRQPYGPGYALAAKVAHPDRQVCLLLGDGAFGFSGLEFDTFVRHGIPVVGVMGNNGIWALEKHPMEFLYGYSVAAELQPECRYDQVVEALGGHGELVREPAALRGALERALEASGPALVNVLTDPPVVYPRSATRA